MKKITITVITIIVWLLLGIAESYAQVGVGTALPNNSSQLDVVSTNKGVLIPRVALTSSSDASTITSGNVESLLIYNTSNTGDVSRGFYFWSGTKWEKLVGTNDSGLISSPETLTTLVDNGNGTMTYTDENGTANTINTTVAIQDGTIDIDGDGTNDNGVTLQDVINNINNITSANETLTTLVDNGNGTMTYTDENGTANTINTTVAIQDGTIDIDGDGTNDNGVTLQDVINNINNITSANETLTTLVDNGNGTMTYTDENGTANTINTTVAIQDGTIDIDGDGTNDNGVTLQDVINNINNITSANETLTTLVDNGNGTSTYTDENGTANSITNSVASGNVQVADGTIDVDGDGTPDNNVSLQDVVTNINNITSANETVTTLVDNGNGTMTYTDENATANTINTTIRVDDSTVEMHATNGVQVKDDGVTTAKIGTAGATDANKLLGTDASGNPEWQVASAVATSLGEDVTSTNGSISGTQADAALVAMDLQVNVDDTTIEVNATNGVQVKDDGITTAKIGTAGATDANKLLGTDASGNPEWQVASAVATSLGEDVTSTNGSISGTQADAALVAMDLQVNVDDTTIEVNATNGVQVKDDGITTAKIGTAGATDANKLLGTDASGNPEWQVASAVATSLGEDVTSTNGSISGTQADAALVAMDLQVNVDDTTIEVNATNGVQVKDDGVTTAKIGTAGATDANKLLGTDASGNPEWQVASAVATSLGEDVTSTNGSISGTQADAALVAMDLQVNVDDTTIEVNATNGVQVKDDGITTAKIGTAGATDANKLLGTDASGNPEWQVASAVATSLGEDVTSTNGSISGTQADAALVAMDLQVNVDDTTIEVNATNGVQVKDDGVTTAKIGTAGATDANKLLGTDASGNPEWQNIATAVKEPWFGVTSGVGAVANTENIYVSGRVAIGQNTLFGTTARLSVNGSIETTTSTYPDYVFEDYLEGTSTLNKEYKFSKLDEVFEYIKANKHLPGVTSIKELKKTEEGTYAFDISTLSVQILEKVEELYLHTIEQQKELKAKDDKIKALEERLLKIELLINQK